MWITLGGTLQQFVMELIQIREIKLFLILLTLKVAVQPNLLAFGDWLIQEAR
jgi:hypothetical protein